MFERSLLGMEKWKVDDLRQYVKDHGIECTSTVEKKNLGVTSCYLALVHNKKLSYRRDSV